MLMDVARQEKFASLSGDYNPLHVDALQARRSQFGTCVVHGVHLVLAGLEAVADRPRQQSRLVRLDAQFRSAVLVGEQIWIHVDETDEGAFRVEVGVGSQTRTTLSVELASAHLAAIPTQPSFLWPHEVTASPGLDQLADAHGTETLDFDSNLASDLFPGLLGSLHSSDIGALLAVTRVIGMRCPGQWALFRRLSWLPREVHDAGGATHWSVAQVNSRYSMVKVQFDVEGSEAIAEVVVRETPPQQLSSQIIRQRVESAEFGGVRALVVGASRGLGELCAKVLGAGGAELLLTYSIGADDAVAVAADIGPLANIAQLTVGVTSVAATAAVAAFAPTHVFFFATPTIAKQAGGRFDIATYERLHAVYATGLATTLNLAQDAGALRTVFFPSTVFVEEHPVGFAEYVAAKLAGEAVCDAWLMLHPEQSVIVERFPPLVTDQTAAKLGNDTDSNLQIVLSALRGMRTGAVPDNEGRS